VAAEERLAALGEDGAMFTSGLSINEFSLLTGLGPRPLAQVMGASVVRPGLQLLPALAAGINDPGMGLTNVMASGQMPMIVSKNRITDASPSQVRNYKWHVEVVCELGVLTEAWNTARRRALDRLTQEAVRVGGDTVVGVHLHRGDHDLGARTIDYVVTGTAIRGQGLADGAGPSLTNLSTQDLWRLERAGYTAVGLLAATIVVFASPPRSTRARRRRTPRRNQELTELSQGFHLARDKLRVRLQGQVADAHGDGAVGVRFVHSVHREKLSLASSLYSIDRRGWQRNPLGIPYYVSGRGEAERRGWVITMHMAGTAVRRRQQGDFDDVKTAIRLGAR
jgi:uncharacterized protein YbjQ (UPF0145 family)